MNARTLSMAIAAGSLAILPVAAEAGTTASSVSSVGARSSAAVSQPQELRNNAILLYILGFITVGVLIALLSGGKTCQSRGASISC